MSEKFEIATLGAGCFWCVEAVFQQLKGVHLVVSGYAGGTVENPTYHQVCSGTTGHAEAVQMTFDPQVISFEELLDVFWHTHDPTTLNQQGADVGTQYRSVIFYHNEEQKAIAEKSKREAEASRLWSNPIVTEIVPLRNFYKAEEYHENFYRLNSNQPYCWYVIEPKIQKLRKEFHGRLKETAY
ncbi:MAG: peptide-methionine (S)-S-oxide reductase MsrA [Candidatus Tectomicrobia bacterium]|nr:peptide-methionine (S)-S-oxide reductase MsrA [Candidatus Tectomicrobia bacterium]